MTTLFLLFGSRRPIISSLLALALSSLLSAAAPGQGIISSSHNLSASGPGPVRATAESQICVFCHTPHGGRSQAPLWNRHDSQAAYIPYNSPSLLASPGQPTGASKLCLSCHDGTVAMGDLVSGPSVAFAGSPTMPPGRGLIGTDLRDDHPISFNFYESLAQAGGRIASPAGWDPRVRLDQNSMLQCTTCHDPHNDQWGRFLVMPNQESALCRQCHQYPLFALTPHADSTQRWNGAGVDPWPHTDYPDVRANACLNCHRSHHAPGAETLLSSAREEEVCFTCHNGNVASYNLEAVFQKFSAHPVARQSGVHQSGESPLAAYDHVECADCHNPHRARRSPAQPPLVMGALEGVSGIDIAGSPLAEARYEYEVCFKCHAREEAPAFAAIERQVQSFNLRREFSPSSPSFHPVAVPGRNPDVPSLLPPLNEASMIYCGDCHGHDGEAPQLIGSAGPHGSSFPTLLKRQYRTGDEVAESPTAYALCYGCHSRESILANQSFPAHSRHIQQQRVSCAVCHDPHGIDQVRGSALNNAHLINFDLSVVRPDPASGRLEYRSLGPRAGECFLSCHGSVHNPRSY